MTARSLPNYSVRNARRVIKQNMKLAIVTCILEALGIPLIMGAVMIHQIGESMPDTHHLFSYASYMPYMMIGSTCLAVSVVLGLFHAIVCFQETWSRSRVDMLYSLPLNGTQRFFSHFAGGALMYLVPYAVAAVLGALLVIVLNFFVRAGEFGMTQAEHLQMILLYYGKLACGLFLLMCMYYTLSVLVTACCGTLFESIYTNLLLNLLIPGALAAVIAVITFSVDGLDFVYSWDIIGLTSPIGGLIYLIYLVAGGAAEQLLENEANYSRVFVTQAPPHTVAFLYIRWVIVILVLTVAMAVLAWQLYRRRKSERVGQPFVWVGAYYLMLILVTVCILCLMTVGMGAAAILFAAIVFFIFEIIRKRGFRRFWLSACVFVGVVTVCIGGYFLTIGTGCFGRDRYIPPLASVSSVQVKMDTDFGMGYDIVMEFTDRDVIRAVQDAQRSFDSGTSTVTKLRSELKDGGYQALYFNHYAGIDSEEYGYQFREDTEDEEDFGLLSRYIDYYTGSYVLQTTHAEITYYTVTGTQCHRSYQLLADDYITLYKAVAGTGLYAQGMSKYMNYQLENCYATYDETYEVRTIPNKVDFSIYFASTEQRIELREAPDKLHRLVDAYRQDLEGLTAEQLLNGETYCTIQDIRITQDCTATVTLLQSWGFQGAGRLQDIIDSTLYGYYDSSAQGSIMNLRLYAPDAYRFDTRSLRTTLTDHPYIKGEPLYDDAFATDALYLVDDKTISDVCQLIEASRRPYSTQEDCYLLLINGESYLIPMEEKDLVESVAKGGSVMDAYEKYWDKYDFDDPFPDDYDDFGGDSYYTDDEYWGGWGDDAASYDDGYLTY